ENVAIFWDLSDRPWIKDGANVHVSMVGFGANVESAYALPQSPATAIIDGVPVTSINANPTSVVAISDAAYHVANANLTVRGTTKQGPFDIDEKLARKWLLEPNPHGRPNSDILSPWINGMAVTKRTKPMWIIDFFNMPEGAAKLYELPYQYA